MRSNVARSAQDPSGGRLAGARSDTYEDWQRHGGGQALRIAAGMAATRVNGILTASGLRDRLEPGRPLGATWAPTDTETAEPRPDGRLVVDARGHGLTGLRARALIDQDPFVIVEGTCIALRASGMARARIQVSAEDRGAERRLRRALGDMIGHGWTDGAQVEVIATDEHDRARRIDIESVAHVAWILAHGVRSFRMLGTAASPGTTLCTVVGDVVRPGVFEVPLGLPIGTLVRDVAGGRDVKAVHRGSSLPVLTADELDEPLCFEAMAGGLGQGLFHVHDATRNIVDVLWSLLHDRSTPWCRECALAGDEMSELLRRCRRGHADLNDLEALLWRSQTIADDHDCGRSGQAYVGVRSTVAGFIDEFVATIHAGRATPGCLPAMPWWAPDQPPAIEPRWCDSPQLGPSVLVTGGAEHVSGRRVPVAGSGA
jgi:NADH-quinone oxidoreductase subunit F